MALKLLVTNLSELKTLPSSPSFRQTIIAHIGNNKAAFMLNLGVTGGVSFAVYSKVSSCQEAVAKAVQSKNEAMERCYISSLSSVSARIADVKKGVELLKEGQKELANKVHELGGAF